jgi:hypothetical protein
VFLIRTRRVGLPVDAGIAGFAIGTGFALVENLYYLAARPHTVLAVQVIRGFGTAIMHGGTAAILAMISNTLYERRPSGGLHLLLPGLLTAVALHTGYNYLLVRPALATLATLLVLPFVIYLVFDHSERILRNWIEVDLDSDVKLLEAISTGRFLGTSSGHYLAPRRRDPGQARRARAAGARHRQNRDAGSAAAHDGHRQGDLAADAAARVVRAAGRPRSPVPFRYVLARIDSAAAPAKTQLHCGGAYDGSTSSQATVGATAGRAARAIAAQDRACKAGERSSQRHRCRRRR